MSQNTATLFLKEVIAVVSMQNARFSFETDQFDTNSICICCKEFQLEGTFSSACSLTSI